MLTYRLGVGSLVVAATALGFSVQAYAQAGTFTPVALDTVTGSPHRNAILMTDGTVLAQSDADGHVWSRLVPDASGNYANGTWIPAARTVFDRRYFPYSTLRDARAFVAGGEDLGANETDHNALELYDPSLNVWLRAPDGPLGDIGDDPYQILADGRIIFGHRSGPESQIYDPASNQWTVGPSKAFGIGTQETWNLLPNGDVLNWTSSQPFKYVPQLNQWIVDTVPPITMQNSDSEVGPGVFLYSGRLLAVSAFGATALYTPGATPTATGTWTRGPNLPPPASPNDNPNGSQWAEDVPACIEPNGKVLLVSSDTIFGEARFSEYDPSASTITPIVGPPLPSGLASFALHMVALPNGQILLTGTTENDFVYTPVGGPQDAWRPTIQSVAANADGSFTVTGTQLNGLSQGASYGDEGNSMTNWPLIRLTRGAVVRFAETFDHSTMGFATGSSSVQTHFVLPPDIGPGTYQVQAVANGIASTGTTSITVPASRIAASASAYTVWDTGYCVNVTVTNTRPQAISSWTVSFNLRNATFNAQWNAIFTQNGSTLTASNRNFNGALAAGASTTFGFCTQTPTLPLGPLVTNASGT